MTVLAITGIVLGVVSPHPPIVVPEIGEQDVERVRATRDGLQQMAGLVADIRPDTVVIVSPHGPVLRDAMTLMASPILEGNFREFGIAGTSLRYGNDLRLVNRTVEEAAKRDVNVFAADARRAATSSFADSLHYSILVPLYYLKLAGVESRLVAGTTGPLSEDRLFAFGQAVEAASRELGIRIVYIASGDLSHRLTDGAPAGYDPMGKVFDQKVVDALSSADVRALRELDPELIERAGECGLGPILTLFGALDGRRVLPQVLSYEGPFGVGYCVATFTPTGPAAEADEPVSEEEVAPPPRPDDPKASGPGLGSVLGPPEPAETGARPPAGAGDAAAEEDSEEARRRHPLVRLARLSLETYVRSGRKIDPPPGVPGLDRRAGAFVSLKKQGRLRGCIGTLEAGAPNLAEEVIRNAIQSGTADPRFYPVEESELPEIVYSVDVLEPAEPVASLADLNPKTYGVIVTKGQRTGLLLPDLEGVDTVEDQVDIAMQKAGIPSGETGVSLYRFKVTRYR